MKKKIRDLTIQEMLNIHNDKDFDGCDNCPFDNTILCSVIHDKHQREYLDKEVKIKKMKDLEQKELLENELKLEKDKVKYVMKQLKKQDEILEILKKNIEIVDTDFVDEDGDDIFKIQLKPLDSSNQRKLREWVDNEI